MTVEPLKRADPELTKALAAEASDLLANRAFDTSVLTLRKQWFGELMDPEVVDTMKVMELVFKLRALQAIPQLLDHLVDSEKMALKYARRS